MLYRIWDNVICGYQVITEIFIVNYNFQGKVLPTKIRLYNITESLNKKNILPQIINTQKISQITIDRWLCMGFVTFTSSFRPLEVKYFFIANGLYLKWGVVKSTPNFFLSWNV